jgi:hypothetical protein
MSTMYHHTHQSTAASSRRLTNDDRPKTNRPAYFFHPYNNEGGAAAVGVQLPSHHGGGRWEMRAEEERGFDDDDEIHDVDEDLDDDDDDDDAEQDPMDILYEREVKQQLGSHYRHHRHDDNHHLRRQSEPIVGSPSSARDDRTDGAAPDDLDLLLSMSADHLVALLQREDSHYSTPLPVRYYPTEFAEEEEAPPSSSSSSDDVGTASGDDGVGPSSSSAPRRSSSSATIGPWRKRIASWMYDVVDHFHYDRNAVSIALSYIDRHVAHVLVENDRNNRRRRGGTGAGGDGGGGDAGGSPGGQQRGEPPIKRRHFQLIAVTCLYLAIKVHGELMEDDPVTGEAYDVVSSLVHEVDGRAFAGARGDGEEMIEEEEEDGGRAGDDEDCDDDLRAMSRKIADLTRRHRMGRWGSRLGQFGLPLSDRGDSSSSADTAPRAASAPPTTSAPSSRMPAEPYSSLPYKPRKRGMLSGPLRLTSFVELSRGLFTARDIVETEMRVLVSMNYVVNPPTSRRVVGELLRMMALCYCGAAAATADGSRRAISAEAAAVRAEREVGLDRREILGAVLGNAQRQIEAAAAVPALSMGCLPSVVAYGAMLNAVEEEFEKVASSAMETDRVDDSPQLEDYQRHYRRYSRSQSSGGGGGGGGASWSPARARRPSDRELFLEAWKEQFLAAVYHATDGILAPDSDDIFRVRELLLDQARPATGAGAQSAAATATATATATSTSPTEGPKSDASKTRRSPRSPRSVIFPNPRMLRGGSFFRLNSGVLSPYDARGRSPLSFRSLSSSVATATAALPHRMYHKQTSEPIAEVHAGWGGGSRHTGAGGRSTRAQTPDVSVFQNDASRRGNGSNYEADSWGESTGAAFQPANSNPPLSFSA